MPTTAMDEVMVALEACRTLGVPPDRVGRSLGPYRAAFLEASVHPERMNEHDLRTLARNLRNAALLFRLERDCRAGLFSD